jgi:hypothetical protein
MSTMSRSVGSMQHSLAQRHAVDALRRDEAFLAELPDVIDREEGWMIERGGRARLVLETRADPHPRAPLRRGPQRNRALQLGSCAR